MLRRNGRSHKRSDCDRKERANALIIVVVFMVALFAFCALSVDVGNAYVQRTHIQEAGDAAALAAVRDWAVQLPAATASQTARNFAAANGVMSNEVQSVRVGSWNATSHTFTAKDSLTSSDVPAVEVTMQRTVNMAFASVVGLNAMAPRTVSIAVAARAMAVAQALPWGVCSNALTVLPSKCDTVIAKNGNDCASSGNYGALALGGTGSSVYRRNIVTGYQGVLYVGQYVNTEPGNMVGPTTQGLRERLDDEPPYDCTATSPPPTYPRLAVLPVISDMPGSGRSQPVQIIGFWTVALNNPAGGGEVTVQFVEVFNGTRVDPSMPPIIGQPNGVILVK